MMRRSDTLKYRASRLTIMLCTWGAVIAPLAVFWIYREDGFTLFAGLGIAVCLCMLAGLIDALTTFVLITEDELVIFSNFRHLSYTRSNFSAVTWARGCPVSLHLRLGGQVEFPSLSASSQSITNTISSWLKQPSPVDPAAQNRGGLFTR